jgi:outer membrane protein OmpA-like peptidoglycan-associated protein
MPHEDGDGDGVSDVDDLCPSVAEDLDGFEDGNGCPDPDNDADRIDDIVDACPNDPETYNGYKDEDGCPDKSNEPPIHVCPTPVVMDYVEFGEGQVELTYEATKNLDLWAEVLMQNPQILRVLVIGTANEKPSSKKNIALSLKRAKAVVVYMEKKGVPKGILVPAGFGELCLDPTWETGSNARRVRFKILQIDTGCTGVELACQAAIDKGLVPHAAKCLPGKSTGSSTGFLSISTVPGGMVYVDGMKLEHTPILKHELTAGKHAVSIQDSLLGMKADYDVIIGPGQDTIIIKTLWEHVGKHKPWPEAGMLSVEIASSGPVNVAIDGQDVEQSNDLFLRPGPHEVTVWSVWIPGTVEETSQPVTVIDTFTVLIEPDRHLVVQRHVTQGAALAPVPGHVYKEM